MRLDEPPLVGNAAARSVHGYSSGADALVLAADPDPGLVESLEPFGLVLHPLDTRRRPDWLSIAAGGASTSADRPLVLVAADLQASPVALLDLLDRPGDPTAVLTVDPRAVSGDPSGLTRVRVEESQRRVHSVGTSRHTVTRPTGYAAGILRIAGSDRQAAAARWSEAALSVSAREDGVDPWALALLALVRGGVPVGVVPAGPYDLSVGGSQTAGARGSAWQQRLRGASRGGDGFVSTYAVRPLSRRVTALGLRRGWSPNSVTAVSLAVGLTAAALAAVDSRWAWVLAAVLLWVSLVVDCVDGEIARFTRRFSALGAWLDAVGDRVKETLVLAAVAWVGVRRGEALWQLAMVALVLLTLRHLEDYAYASRWRGTRAHVEPDRLAVDEPRDLGPDGARIDVPAPASRPARALDWAKRVLHLPIAERYLLLSIGLLSFSPGVLLWTITVAVAVAALWTQGGRTVKALLRRDGFRPEPGLSPSHWGHLDHETDLGPLARAAGRVASLPFAIAAVGCLFVVAAAVVLGRGGEGSWPAVGLLLVGVVLVGAGARPPVLDRIGWQLPAALWVAEAAVVLAVVAPLPRAAAWVGYAYLAAVAWHRHDVVYRLRDTGRPAPGWVTAVTLGVDGRWLVLAIVAVLGGPVEGVLGWGALVLFVVYAAESVTGWRRAVHPAGTAAPDSDDIESTVTA